MPRETRSGTSSPGGFGDRATGSGSSVNGIFRKEGEYWTVGCGNSSFRFKDTKGFAYLAHLLRHPGTEFHVLDLAGGIAGHREDDEPGQAQSLPRGDQDLEKAGIHIGSLGDAGEMLDERAKAAYRRRLSELREELKEAKELGKVERAEQAEEEIDALTRELSRAVGLGGRDRRAGSASDRARQSISKSIKAVVERIVLSDAALGDIFSRCIKTGVFCSYQPDPDFSDLVGIRGYGLRYYYRANRGGNPKWPSRSSACRASVGTAGGAGSFPILAGGANPVCGPGIRGHCDSRVHR
jgi:hypothetical protein